MIIILSTALFASTVGTYVAIRKIKQYTRPPVNTLQRRGDIELNYIEPTQPPQAYSPMDLLEPEFQTNYYDRVPSYRSGTLPSYQSIDINCCLENSINLDFILWLMLVLTIIILIRN